MVLGYGFGLRSAFPEQDKQRACVRTSWNKRDIVACELADSLELLTFKSLIGLSTFLISVYLMFRIETFDPKWSEWMFLSIIICFPAYSIIKAWAIYDDEDKLILFIE